MHKRVVVMSVLLAALCRLVAAPPAGAETPAAARVAGLAPPPAPGAPFVEYTRLPPGNWTVVGLTPSSPAPTLSGELTRFIDPVTGLVNVYVSGSQGHLVEYTRMPGGDWGSLDITAVYRAPTIVGTPQPFVDPLTRFQNVYARTTAGDMIAYTRLAAGNWVTANFSATYGLPRIASDAEPFTDPLTHFQNVYGTTGAGHMIEYTRLPPGNWTAVDLTARWHGPTGVGQSIPFTDPLTHFQNAYLTTPAGHVTAYTRLADGSWTAADFTALYGLPQAFSDPQPFVDPANGQQSVYVRAVPANAKATLWGVDSCAVANQQSLSSVQAQFGTPDFWGRYLAHPSANGAGFCAVNGAEVGFLHANGVRVLVIDNFGTGNEAGTYVDGQASASFAIASALNLGVPSGVAIYHDIEASDPVSAAWIQGWFDQMKAASTYLPAVYANPLATSSQFSAAYCRAVQAEAAIGSHLIVWSDQPQLAFTTKAGTFPFSPTVPQCGASVPAWQYVIVGVTGNIVDQDQAQVPAAALW